MSLHRPSNRNRYEEYRKKNGLVVVKYGAEWCGPCRQIIPLVEKLAKQYTNVFFLDVDIDNQELSEHSDLDNVRTIPHFKFFLDGELKRECGGDDDKIKRYVKRYSEVKRKD